MSTLTLTPEISKKQATEKHSLSQALLDGFGVASGIGFMVVFSYASGLAGGPPTESNQLMADFYIANKEAILQVVYWRSLAMLLFLIFTCTLADLIRRRNKEHGLLSGLVLTGGSLASILMILGQAAAGVAARITDTKDINPDIIRVMDETSHVVVHLFSAPLGIFLLAVTGAIFLGRLVPRVIGILSGLSGITLLVTCGTFNSQHILHSVGMMALMGFLLWTLIITLTLLWIMVSRQIAGRSYTAR